MKPKTLQAISVTLCLLGASSVVADVHARERERSGSFTTGKGRTGQFQGQATGNLRDGLTRNQSITTDGGRNFQRDSTTQYNRETGAFTREVNGVNGESRTMSGTAGDGQRSGTYTTSTGKSGSFEGTTTRNGEGTVSNQGSWTNAQGETKTHSGSHHYDRETNTLESTVTGPRGNTRSGSVTVTPNRP